MISAELTKRDVGRGERSNWVGCVRGARYWAKYQIIQFDLHAMETLF